jgi:hypothetical protein
MRTFGVLEGKRRSLYRMHRAAVTTVTSTALAAHDEAQEDKDLDEEFTAIKCEDGNGSSSEEDDGEDDDSNLVSLGNFGHHLPCDWFIATSLGTATPVFRSPAAILTWQVCKAFTRTSLTRKVFHSQESRSQESHSQDFHSQAFHSPSHPNPFNTKDAELDWKHWEVSITT